MPIANTLSHCELLLRMQKQIEATYLSALAEGAGEAAVFLIDMLDEHGRSIAERANGRAAVAASLARAPKDATELLATWGVPLPLMADLVEPDSTLGLCLTVSLEPTHFWLVVVEGGTISGVQMPKPGPSCPAGGGA